MRNMGIALVGVVMGNKNKKFERWLLVMVKYIKTYKEKMDEPRTRKDSKKTDKEKKYGHNKIGSGKGTRQKIALFMKDGPKTTQMK